MENVVIQNNLLVNGVAAGFYLSEAPYLLRFLFGVVSQFCSF
jgi:hypothetical protein